MLAHLYRGEMYRSKIWRTRLDATTNWAVATTGIALFVTASNANNSPLPLLLVALMPLVFLSIEGRRYRYFDIWRTRVRILETGMYGPMLRGEGVRIDNGWNQELARDYEKLRFLSAFWKPWAAGCAATICLFSAFKRSVMSPKFVFTQSRLARCTNCGNTLRSVQFPVKSC